MYYIKFSRENNVPRTDKQSHAEGLHGLQGQDPEQADPQGSVQGCSLRRQLLLPLS